MAFVVRLMRGSMLEILRADHVRTAIAKGLPRRLVIRRHVVRNSLIPVDHLHRPGRRLPAGAARSSPRASSTSPGVGGLVARAIRIRENATVVGVTTILVLVILVVNLLVDLLYAVLDPRIRYD